MKRVLSGLMLLLFSLLFLLSASAAAEGADEGFWEEEEIILTPDGESFPAEQETGPAPDSSAAPADHSAREAFIDDIIALGKKLFDKAGGKLQRAHYRSDIYVCKNFTVYLFRQTRDAYRMAEYPATELKIPDNLSADKCKPYAYGYCWEDIPASDGNPFEIAAQFLYDTNLSKQENRELALEFMRQVRRGDYFQMTAKYSHGTGAHSAVMIADYDPETDTVHWMDSNMVGKKIDGIRYGKVQFDVAESIDWWVDAFCQKKRGATLYRLRDDIIFADEQ